MSIPAASLEEDQTDEEVSEATRPEDADNELDPVTYYGTDFDVDGLVRRLQQGDIVVPNFEPEPATELDVAGFQRRFVWKKPQMDKFIESLLLGFPIPGIFLVEQEDRRLLVLDGQQRLKTLRAFLEGTLENGTPFSLENVEDDFKDLTFEKLDPVSRRTLINTFIHATVTRFPNTSGGANSVYSIFERLNTGGTNLYPQEIRVALFPGSLVDFIRNLNNNEDWREIFGPKNVRLKDQELILRFLAFRSNSQNYKRPLKGFLNEFLRRHQQLQQLDSAALSDSFSSTCQALRAASGRAALRNTGQINAALSDAMLIGTARRLDRGPILDVNGLDEARKKLLNNSDFIASIGRATADEERVERRLSMATDAFEGVK